jgi:hypothetical protein
MGLAKGSLGRNERSDGRREAALVQSTGTIMGNGIRGEDARRRAASGAKLVDSCEAGAARKCRICCWMRFHDHLYIRQS